MWKFRLVWFSDSYKEMNQEKIDTIVANKDKPWVSDDLFHAILDINQIKSPYFQPKRSIFNKDFNDKRPRVLMDGRDYDKH